MLELKVSAARSTADVVPTAGAICACAARFANKKVTPVRKLRMKIERMDSDKVYQRGLIDFNAEDCSPFEFWANE